MTSVHVHRVSYGLEGVEGDTHGQNDVLHGQIAAQQGVQHIYAEIGVLEI